MALDLTKPIRCKKSKELLRFLGLLANNPHPVVCAFTTDGIEGSCHYDMDELENVPESRWLNVYARGWDKARQVWHDLCLTEKSNDH